MQYLGAASKMTEWSVYFQGKLFNITVIQVYAPITNAREEVEQFYEDLQDFPELTHTKKDVLFIIRESEKCSHSEIIEKWFFKPIWNVFLAQTVPLVPDPQVSTAPTTKVFHSPGIPIVSTRRLQSGHHARDLWVVLGISFLVTKWSYSVVSDSLRPHGL